MTTKTPYVCNSCRCVITQEQADEADRIFHSENTYCPECASGFAGEEANRARAIDILRTTILPEDIGLGGYRDSAAYKLANGDIGPRTDGLSNDVREALRIVGTLEFEDIGR